MINRLLALYEGVVLKHPLLTLTFIVLAALGLALGLPNFKLDASADSLTLEHDADLDYFRAVNQRYGSSDFLVATYTPKQGDLFSDQNLATLKSLAEELAQVKGVTNVQSIVTVPLLYSPKISIPALKNKPRTLLDKDTNRQVAKQEFLNSPIYRNLILSPDGQTTALLANLQQDKKYLELVRRRDALRLKQDQEGLTDAEQQELEKVSREFLDYRTARTQEDRKRVREIRNLMDRYRDKAQLFLGGPSMITADMIHFIQSDLRIFGTGIVLFIILTLAIIFRQARWVFLPLATCLLSVEMMLGWLSWVDWRLTVISSNFVSLLLIITLALTIHLIVRYREYRRDNPGWEQQKLVRETVVYMARPCLYTVLTTMVAFVSLVVSNIRPVIDFGWMMTIGISLALVLAFVVIPAGMMLLGKGRNNDNGDHSAAFTRHFAHFTENHGTGVLAIALVLAAVAGYGITRLEVDNRFIDYFRPGTEIYQGLSVIDAKLGGTTPLDIIIQAPQANAANPQGAQTGSGEADPFDAIDEDPFATAEEETTPQSYWFSRAGLEKLEKLHAYLESLPEIGKVNSLVTAFHVANDLTGHRMNDFELAFMRQSLSPEIHDFLIAPYLDEAHHETRLSLRTLETDGELRRAELLNQLHGFMQNEIGLEKDQYHFTSLLVLYNNMLQSLYKSQILTLGAVFIGIMLMFLVLFRSLKVSLIAILPNLLAAAIVLGGMGIAGVPLDMMTITIAAITVGIGVDNAIHYITRFKREFAVDGDYLASMHRAHGSIGRALFYTAITIIVGFSILSLSNFIPSVYFGLLTGLAMAAALLGALTLLPKLILVFKPFGESVACDNSEGQRPVLTTNSSE